MNKISLPRGLKIIIAVNIAASSITVLFWVLIFLKVYIIPSPSFAMDNSMKASTLGYLITDMLIAVPILIASISGLRKLKFWGWLMAQAANVLWIYSLFSVWARDLYAGQITPGDIIFAPLIPFSFWAFYYLWKNRNAFYNEN